MTRRKDPKKTKSTRTCYSTEEETRALDFLREALECQGYLPTTDPDRVTDVTIPEDLSELPPQMRDIQEVLARGACALEKGLQLIDHIQEENDNYTVFAAAARKGKLIPEEMLDKMRQDRIKAEQQDIDNAD